MRLVKRGRIPGLHTMDEKHKHDFESKDCVLGKRTRLQSPPAPEVTRATTPLALVHTDIWGPASVTSIGGSRYFLTCYDD